MCIYTLLPLLPQVRYANALAPTNQTLFDACDGLFTNYWWGARELAASAELALASGSRDRRHDVYMGVDVFGRNTRYAAGLGCAPACRAAREHALSLALFAPGWSFESAGCDTREADRRFWDQLRVRRLFRGD